MPEFLSRIFTRTANPNSNESVPVRQLEGFQVNGAVVLRDLRGALKAEIPDIDLKSESLGSDPLAVYKPTGAKSVDAAKAMGNFTGWTFTAVNAIASEVANIQHRLYQIKGDDHEEQDDQTAPADLTVTSLAKALPDSQTQQERAISRNA